MDGLSKYNQIPRDQHKTTFVTKFGMFAYKQMPFGLASAVITYQWGGDHIFASNLGYGVETYVDDLCCHLE